MNVLVSARGFRLTSDLRNQVIEHIMDSFHRFQVRVQEVRVYLSDENGPKRGIDRTIQLVVDISHLPLVLVKEKGSDWESTLNRASERAIQSLNRNVARRRSHSGTISMAGTENVLYSQA